MKTAEQFRESAIKNNIDYWAIHNCSMCNYECGFLFFQYEDAEVAYDAGCDCTRSRRKQARNWDEVAQQYNSNINNEAVIKRYNALWCFES